MEPVNFVIEWFEEKPSEIDQWFYENHLLFPEDFKEWEKNSDLEHDSDEEFDFSDFLAGY